MMAQYILLACKYTYNKYLYNNIANTKMAYTNTSSHKPFL